MTAKGNRNDRHRDTRVSRQRGTIALSRPQRLYRLHVDYPTEPNAEMKRWMGEAGDGEAWHFHWPSIRSYQSRPAAEKRAELLRKYGCTVRVEESEPVVWNEDAPTNRAPYFDWRDIEKIGASGEC